MNLRCSPSSLAYFAFLPCRARLPDASGCGTYRIEWRPGGPSCSSTSGMASTYPSPPDEPFCCSSRPEMRRTHPCSPPSDLYPRTRSRAADRDRSQRYDRFGPFGSRSRQYHDFGPGLTSALDLLAHVLHLECLDGSPIEKVFLRHILDRGRSTAPTDVE